MQRWNDDYGVFVGNTWQWFSSYQEAAQVEAEELCRKVRRKLQAGGTVILVEEQGQRYAMMRSRGENTGESYNGTQTERRIGAKPERALPPRRRRKTR